LNINQFLFLFGCRQFVYNTDADKLAGAYNGKMYYDGVNRRTRVEGQHGGQKYVVIQLFEEVSI
jgi:hypothetical protein